MRNIFKAAVMGFVASVFVVFVVAAIMVSTGRGHEHVPGTPALQTHGNACWLEDKEDGTTDS